MKKLARVFVVVPFALAACGGGSYSTTKPNVNPAAYVKQAATATADLKSEHMEMTATVDGLDEATALEGSGDFANDPVKSSYVMTVSGAGETQTIEQVTDGSWLYMRSIGIAGDKWIKLDLTDLPNGSSLALKLFWQNPSQLLEQLAGTGSVKSLGTETIDGVETTHYQATDVDLSKFPLAKELDDAEVDVTFGPIDVWIRNSDGYVARESLSLSGTDDGKDVSVSVTVNFSKFNEPVTVTVPPPSEVMDMDEIGGGSTTMSATTTVTIPGADG